jgi:hypothetical protein
VFSQNFTPVFKNITDGLPSSEVYDIYGDSIGYLWFATDKGFCKYDGQKFQEKGSIAIFRIIEERNNKVWIYNENNELYYFNPYDKNIELIPYKYNDVLRRSLNEISHKLYLRLIKFIDNKLYGTFLTNTGYIVIDNKGKFSSNGISDLDKKNHYKSQFFILISKISYTIFKNKKETQGSLSIISKKDTTLIDSLFTFKDFPFYGISDKKIWRKDTLVILSEYLIIKNNTIKVVKLPSKGLCIYKDDNKFFIGTFNGVYEINSSTNMIENHFLNNHIITKIYKDFEGGFWFSTIDDGLFYSKEINLLLLNDRLTPNKIVITKNNIFVWDKKSQLKVYTKKGKLLESIRGVSYQHYNWITNNKKLSNYSLDIIDFNEDRKLYSYSIFENKANKTNLFSAYGKAIYLRYGNKLNKFRVEGLPHLNDCKSINDSIILLASNKGLFKLNVRTKDKEPLKVNSEYNGFYKKIEPFRKGFLIASDKGLFYFHTDTIVLLNNIYKTLNNNLNDLLIINDTLIVTASDQGVDKILVSNSKIKINKISYYNGLPSNEVLSLASDSNSLWIGTKKGLCKIDINKDIVDFTPKKEKFIIDSILINKELQQNQDTFYLPYNGTLELYYHYLTFKNKETQKIYYELNNFKSNLTNENRIVFSNLLPKTYNLKIFFEINNEVILNKIIISQPHFTQTFLFRLIFILFLITLPLLLLNKYNNLKKKRKEKEFNRVNLELKLLSYQMNPHFTFNTINSIQHFLIKNNKKEGLLYLTEFAKLMRMTLEFSQLNAITIKQEIYFLNLYVKIENKRFLKNYQLKVIQNNENVVSNMIPPLILQPLVENVFKHACYSVNSDKTILIKFIEHEEYIEIKVVDFSNSKYINDNNEGREHKSIGLDLIKKRLHLFNQNTHITPFFIIESTNKFNNTGYTITLKIKKI